MDILALSPISLNSDYKKKWNATSGDFVHLTKNGEKINDSLYRVGGFGVNLSEKYFMLLKYTEDVYPDSITKDKAKKNHLKGRWVIIDNNGLEKKEFLSYNSPYLIQNSCVYSLDNKYYNIETGEMYCSCYNAIKSTEYLFLENLYDANPDKRGVLKINKKDGTFEVFK